MELCMTFIFEV